MPRRSRAQNSVRRRLSQRAKANMPRNCSTARGTVLFKGMKDGFRIAVSAVAVSGCLQRRPQRRMVKDFAVVNDPKRLVFIGPGLVSQGEIDDASPAMAKDRIFVTIKSTAIRPTMAKSRP